MLAGLLAFEWRYHTRHLTFLAVTLFFAAAAAAAVSTGYGPNNVMINSPYVVAQTLGLISLLSVFPLTILCANAALRDVEHGMAGIIFSTPVGKLRYLVGRFAGALLVSFTIFAVATIVLMVAPFVLDVDPARVGPVRVAPYAWALFVIVLPNLVLAGSILFAVATLSRSTLATYISAIAIYALYIVTSLLVDSPLMAGTAPPTPEGLARAAVLDPFGLSAFFEQTRYWTPAERDVRLIALSGRMLMNRAVWLGASLLVLVATYARFSFRLPGLTSPSARTRREAIVAPPTVAYAPVAVDRTRETLRAAMRSSLRRELRHLLRGWTFPIFLLLWIFVAGMEVLGELGGGEYGTQLLPSTGALLNAFYLPTLLLGTLGIVYYAAEVAWRERVVRIDAIVDSTSADNVVFYLTKVVALVALPFIMAVLATLFSFALQALSSGVDVDPQLFVGMVWYTAVPLAIFAVGAMAVQVLAPNRWLGLIGGLLLALVARQGDTIGLEHPMLRFGAGPSISYSDMDGFGPVGPSFVAFMLYWSLAAIALASFSWGIWRRGAEHRLVTRVRHLRSSLGRGGVRLMLAATTLFIVVGAALFWQTSVSNAWESRDAQAEWSAGYERAYRRIAGKAQPVVVAIRTDVALYPHERRAELSGTLTLENRTRQAIDTIWTSVPRNVERLHTTLRGARTTQHDAKFATTTFALATPLMPGQRTELDFSVAVSRGGVTAGEFDYDVVENGSMIAFSDLSPSIGYRSGRELGDARQRAKYGLSDSASQMSTLADTSRPNAPWITYEATISTSGDQVALMPGTLTKTWSANGRRHAHYVADAPTSPFFIIVSGRYDVRRDTVNGTEVSVWYHPAHAAVVDTISAAARRSLQLLGKRYGAYPRRELRIVEVPSWSNFGGFALPGMILFTEDRGFQGDPHPGDVDLVTRRVAHEVSHQWWPHLLDPADVVGGSFIIETLAKHAEQLVIREMHGVDALSEMLRFDEDRYLSGRTSEGDVEPALLEVAGQDYLYYGKGAIVMNGLRALLSDSIVDATIAALIAEQGGPNGRATSLDFRRLLLSNAASRPDADKRLADEWLTGHTVYDLRIDTATVVAGMSGGFRTTVQLSGIKSTGDVDHPLDGEVIEVTIAFDTAGSHTQRVRFVAGRAILTLDLGRRPVDATVDPFIRRIDRERSNNRKRFTR